LFLKVSAFFSGRDFSNENIELFFKTNSHYCNQTKNNYLKLFKHLGELEGIEIKIPYWPKIRNLDIEILTPAEIKKIADVKMKCKFRKKFETQINIRFKAATYALALGLRIGELCTLRWDDLRADCLIIREGKTENSARKVYITPKIYNLISTLPKKSEFIFGIRGKKLDRSAFTKELKRRAKAVGITKRVYPHLFRHSFITYHLGQGHPIQWVAEHVGHKRWDTTAQYTHLTLRHTKKVVEGYPVFERKSIRVLKEELKDTVESVTDIKTLQSIQLLLTK
jgi:integrase